MEDCTCSLWIAFVTFHSTWTQQLKLLQGFCWSKHKHFVSPSVVAFHFHNLRVIYDLLLAYRVLLIVSVFLLVSTLILIWFMCQSCSLSFWMSSLVFSKLLVSCRCIISQPKSSSILLIDWGVCSQQIFDFLIMRWKFLFPSAVWECFWGFRNRFVPYFFLACIQHWALNFSWGLNYSLC